MSPTGAAPVGTLHAPSADAVREHFARLSERVETSRFRAPAEDVVLALPGVFVDYAGALHAFLAGAHGATSSLPQAMNRNDREPL